MAEEFGVTCEQAPFILGAGRVGSALAIALSRAGCPPLGLWTRSAASAERATKLTGLPCWHGALPEGLAQARLVIVAVSDPAAPLLAAALQRGGLLPSAQVVLHCAGARPAAEALAGLKPPIARGTFHPLLAVADSVAAARRLSGAAVAIEGDELARQTARELARRLGARPVELSAEGLPLYHSAAVLASNHAIAIWAAALELLATAGVPKEEALHTLLPLLSSTLENLAELGIPAALTGPVRRADADRVAAELELVQKASPQNLPLFREATGLALRLVRELGEPALEPGLRRIEALLAASRSVI